LIFPDFDRQVMSGLNPKVTPCQRLDTKCARVNCTVREAVRHATASQAAHMPLLPHRRPPWTKRLSHAPPNPESHPLQVRHLTKETPARRSPTPPGNGGGTPPTTGCSPPPPR